MKIAPFKLERFFAKYEFSAPYLLSSSDCEAVTVQEILDLEPDAADRFKQHWLGYTESEGSPELREAITTLYTTVRADDVLVCAGAEEAIFLFMNSVLDRGDHVIVHTPCYQSLAEIARSIGCGVTSWRADEQNGWALDMEILKRSIRPNTKAIVINCPHNPTGYLMSHDLQRQIVAIARERRLLLFSDEVYRELEQDPADRLPAVCDLYENGVSLGVLSKTYGLPGLRIGWIATRNTAIREAMAHFKDYTSICNSAPSEFLGVVALRHRGHLAARNLQIVRRNLALLDEFFARHADSFWWVRPKAGSIAYPRLKLDRDIEAFCIDVVERQGVLLLPGTCYEADSQHFRIGFGRANMPEALGRFEDYMRQQVQVNG
ncbi:MAG TPA: aminotransferase class I/II-fold pyridoxal phosphate-dependent enzyme [Aggregatilineales bacterium]|nr:aminotransferase class I/II-fold pyridoxal phosphate-dependent enzyme [Aggregatilineales bacterium]